MEEAPVQPQPQVTTKPKPHNWKKVILTVVFIIGVISVVSGIYWFMVVNKSSGDSDLTGPVPKVTTKTSTESAKEGTPSAQKDEKANWISFTSQKLGIQLKHPETWTAEALFGKPEGILVPADTSYILLKQESTGINIKISEGGSLGGPPNITNKEVINLDGIQVTVSTYKGFLPLDGGDPYSTDALGFAAGPLNIGDKDVFILATWNEKDSNAEKMSKEIIKTFKFLD